ncbi:MAG: hypothetical protein GOV02_00920 [Candidatus Aenigmarchaeota archaeon]|nr:hypothetical protein [Candidatus Aenigmarchaeota archaeon]
MKKGLELPVNVLVVVAIAVIVLLGIVALFMSGFGSAASSITTTAEWNEECASVIVNCDANHPGILSYCVSTGRSTNTTEDSNTVTNGCNAACNC